MAFIWHSLDFSFNRLPHDCCSGAGFQRIFIVTNVELYQYCTFIFVAFFRMQHYYGIHLAFLELLVHLNSAVVLDCSGMFNTFEVFSMHICKGMYIFTIENIKKCGFMSEFSMNA